MVLPKSKNKVGLGNSLMNDRFGKKAKSGQDLKKISHVGAVVRTAKDSGEQYVTNEKKEASWMKMQSKTEQTDLEEFLSNAELADTDFTAEKRSGVRIIHGDQANPYLLSAADERGVKRKHAQNRERLTVPRRPKWDSSTSPQQLDAQEKASLLDWRRGLAELQENGDLLMTPFERNLEVWRQLWRTVERSSLVCQIVDSRSPLLFRCEDLEKYVKEVDPNKKNLLLINKADLLTESQRRSWADYFHEQGINYKFFSAQLAKELNEGRDAEEELNQRQEDQIINHDLPEKSLTDTVQDMDQEAVEDDHDEDWSSEDDGEDDGSEDSSSDSTRILTVDELEALFLENIPVDGTQGRTTIGLVGYPNVGKSSTINALMGAKKVSVSATPGHTKHLQTLYLSDRIMLCDCPGLVFPNFATTKAELVCNGILPIDQLREFTGPAGIVAKRIPQAFLENVYGMKINKRPMEEGGTGIVTASELLRAYARARGFSTTGYGQPDESRAARYILKDYVNGKLLYCHPPPHDPEIDEAEFNRELYDFAHLPAKRQAWLIAHNDDSTALDGDTESVASLPLQPTEQPGTRSKQLDKGFFGPGSGSAGHLKMPFSHQYSEQGKELTGRKARTMVALEKDVDPTDLRAGGKKHFKESRRKKRLNHTGDD